MNSDRGWWEGSPALVVITGRGKIQNTTHGNKATGDYIILYSAPHNMEHTPELSTSQRKNTRKP